METKKYMNIFAVLYKSFYVSWITLGFFFIEIYISIFIQKLLQSNFVKITIYDKNQEIRSLDKKI